MAINYVRFQRGTLAAYNILIEKNLIDDNTLYFIYSDKNSNVGSLYMGNKLISGGEINTVTSSLNDLTDVVVSGAETNSFLVKDQNNNWIAKTAQDVAKLIQNYLNNNSPQIFNIEINNNDNHMDAINNLTSSNILLDGDIVIIKELINNNKYEYTSYIYFDSCWNPMNGNYNIDNIYLDTDLIITADIGVHKINSTGFKTLNTTGKNLKEVLDMLVASRQLPKKIEPNINVSLKNETSYEVGSMIDINYNINFNPGQYEFGPNTNVELDKLIIKCNDEIHTTNSGIFSNIIIEDNTKLRIEVIANHSQGEHPLDNLGKIINDEQELSLCQIQQNSIIGNSNYITGFRNIFFGSNQNLINLDSWSIRQLNSIKSNSTKISVPVVENAKHILIALPAGKKITEIQDTVAFGTNIINKFKINTIPIGGFDSTSNNIGNYPKDYKVYSYTPSTALGKNTYIVYIEDE